MNGIEDGFRAVGARFGRAPGLLRLPRGLRRRRRYGTFRVKTMLHCKCIGDRPKYPRRGRSCSDPTVHLQAKSENAVNFTAGSHDLRFSFDEPARDCTGDSSARPDDRRLMHGRTRSLPNSIDRLWTYLSRLFTALDTSSVNIPFRYHSRHKEFSTQIFNNLKND